jgi:hypothetical protein
LLGAAAGLHEAVQGGSGGRVNQGPRARSARNQPRST